VLFDNRAGVTLALEHLHRLGHRRLAVLTTTDASTPDRPADVHVTSEAKRLRLDVTITPSAHGLVEASIVAQAVMCRQPRPTAVFCFSDSIAYGAYAAAKELGLRIPEDISVCGYDNHPLSGLLSPPLTSVDWDTNGIIRDAVRLVLAAADGSHRRKRIVKMPTLMPRASTARRSAAARG
jgi:LacI family transcriptional regulator